VCPIKGEVQQEWRRSSIEELRKKAEEHCEKGVPREAQLLELGWMTEEVVVSRREEVSCRRQPGARSDPLLEVERIKLVWM